MTTPSPAHEGDFALALLASQRRAVEAAERAKNEIANAAVAVATSWKRGGRLVYLGAGSSGLIAAQDGAELPGTFGFDRSRILFLLAGGDAHPFALDGAAEDDDGAGDAEVAALRLGGADCVLAVSASGSTPYTLAGARRARLDGAQVVGIANREGAPLLLAAQWPVYLDSGPEALRGSTRLAAGTAQKCALGLISTLANAELGNIYRGLMINVQPENEKLRRRALDIVASLAELDESAARVCLDRAHGDVRSATLLGAGARDRNDALKRLALADGHFGAALAKLKQDRF
jgi:N-acetylmuramic acid 6-phosphate etherase